MSTNSCHRENSGLNTACKQLKRNVFKTFLDISVHAHRMGIHDLPYRIVIIATYTKELCCKCTLQVALKKKKKTLTRTLVHSKYNRSITSLHWKNSALNAIGQEFIRNISLQVLLTTCITKQYRFHLLKAHSAVASLQLVCSKFL